VDDVASGTTFLVDIQARLSGSGASELQKLQQAAQSAIKGYAELERASAQTQSALDRLGASTSTLKSQMQSAMEAGDSGKFWQLAGKLNETEARAGALRSKLAGLSSQMQAQAAAATAAVEAVDRYNAELKQTSQVTEQATGDTIKASDGVSKLPGPLSRVGGALKEAQEAWQDLSGSLGKFKASAIVAGAAAVALVAILAAGAVKLGAWAIGVADARRNLGLTLEAMTGSESAGAALRSTFDDVSKSTGATSERLLELTRDLKAAGVGAADMPDALKAIALQETALGDSSGTAALVDRLKSGATSAADLKAEMEGAFGGVVQKRMLSLGEQSKTLTRNLEGLFGGANIDGFLEGLARMVALLDGSTESGQALRALFGGLFQPLLDGAGGAFVSIERGILMAQIGALKLGIAVKTAAKEFGFDLGSLTEVPGLGAVGEALMWTLAISVGAVAAAIGVVIAAAAALGAAWDGMAKGATAAWNGLTSGVRTAIDAIKAIDLAEVGKAMIDGLIKGIEQGAGALVASLTGVVGQGVAAAKSALEIKSPSRVFAELGEYTGEGYAMGVEDTAPQVSGAFDSLMTPPEPQEGGGRAASASGPVGPITINIHGVQGIEDALDKLERAVDDIFAGKALAMGATA
jgi:hypothetical protein